MIDLQPKDLATLTAVLAASVPPDWEVWAFGSRVSGQPQPYSDLDLAVSAPSPVAWREIEHLKDAFADSDLPVSVDIVDLAQVAPAFADRIRREGIRLRPADRMSA